MSSIGTPKSLQKRVKGTNVVVLKQATDGVQDEHLALLYSIHPDDPIELQWYHRTLRPDRNLVHPAEGFLEGIKALRPASVFHTFDLKKSKLRRLAKQQKDGRKALERRTKQVAPTAAYRAAMNPHKIPRASSKGVRLSSHEAKPGQGAGGAKRRKSKVERIGKGL